MSRARWAEKLVAEFYTDNGYKIIARNWHCRQGELDVVATLQREKLLTIVIIEVKARATQNYGTALEAVTPSKQKKLRIATAKFLAANPQLFGQVRFDVVGVVGTELDVVYNAF